MLKGIVIASKDIEAAERFYNILGVQFKHFGHPQHMEGKTASGLTLTIDGVDLMKLLDPEFTYCETRYAGPALGFDLEAPADVDALVAAIRSAGFGIKSEPRDAPWGHRFAEAVDPDGTRVELSAPLEAKAKAAAAVEGSAEKQQE